MRTKRAFTHIFALTVACVVALAAAACDDPPSGPSGPSVQIDIDAESKSLDESVEEIRKKADERIASPDESTEGSNEKDDAPSD